MIRLTPISPENEMLVAERLRALIAHAWPDVAASASEHVDILVGIRTPTNVDIVVIVNLQAARPFPAQRRRNGTTGPAGEVRHAIIAIEVKQSDARDMRRIGNQLFASQNGKPATRSVSDQAIGAAHALRSFFGISITRTPYVYALGWLTSLDDETLAPTDAMMLGASATWPAMLDSCVQQNPDLLAPKPLKVAESLITCLTLLTNRKIDTQRTAAKVATLAAERAMPVVHEMLSEAGRKQIQLSGRGGSGKTTALALLAVQLAERGDRVVILTFHRTLRTDIARLVDALAQRCGVDGSLILVDTVMNFIMSALDAWHVAPPLKEDGITVNWDRLDPLLDETRAYFDGDPDDAASDAAKLRVNFPLRFGWDHVLVDESQDWSDAERDFLRMLYGHRRLVLADGRDQLVRRRVACNWVAGIASAEQTSFSLDTSLRMLGNVAEFSNAVARAIGFDAWHIVPNERLPGGRVIVLAGAAVDGPLLGAAIAAAALDRATAADCLVCLPPRLRAHGDERRTEMLAAADSANVRVWDGTIVANRDDAAIEPDALRLVRYDSCRGLEGWTTFVIDLDDLVAQKTTYPNAHPADPVVDPRSAALRWMLIPITRAVHTLIITLRDPQSEVAQILREASSDPSVAHDAITWYESAEQATCALQRLADGPAFIGGIRRLE